MIKIYSASADNTITNAFKSDLQTRGTGSNMGAADILDIFSQPNLKSFTYPPSLKVQSNIFISTI